MYIHHISTIYTPNTPLNTPYIRLNTTFSGSQYTFGSADDCVLDELATSHPDIHAMFPCYLSHCSAVDKDFMATIIGNAVRGTGPGAAAEVMKTEHAARWQQKEIKWLAFLRRELGRGPGYVYASSLPAWHNTVACCGTYCI
jgi:hypothetical protein